MTSRGNASGWSDTSLTGMRVARELDRIAELRNYPCMIVSDNGTELTSNSRRVALHRAGQTDAEWVRRSFTAGCATMPQRALFATSRRRVRSSKNGGSTTTPTDGTRASTGSHQLSSQHAHGGHTGTDSPYKLRTTRGEVSLTTRHVHLRSTHDELATTKASRTSEHQGYCFRHLEQ